MSGRFRHDGYRAKIGGCLGKVAFSLHGAQPTYRCCKSCFLALVTEKLSTGVYEQFIYAIGF